MGQKIPANPTASPAEAGSPDAACRMEPDSHRIIHADGTIEYISKAGEEEEVDSISADSFPASDPPCFTPMTHTGKPKSEEVKQKPR